MKLIASPHAIISVDQPRRDDIPLAYIDTENASSSVDIVLNPDLPLLYSKSQVLPFDKFEIQNPYLFDAEDRRQDISLLASGDKWVYYPDGLVEFTPQQFEVSAKIRRRGAFHDDIDYDLRIGVIDNDGTLSQEMIAVCGDAGMRSVCPPNITINGGDNRIQSLANASIAECDIVFIESADGLIAPGGDPIDLTLPLSTNTTVWLSVDEFEPLLSESLTTTALLSRTLLYESALHTLESPWRFDLTLEHPSYPKSEWTYRTLFAGDCPVLLLEKPGQGYVVISHSSFLNTIRKNYRLFYELLMQLHLSTYDVTTPIKNWISDQPIDFLTGTSLRFGRRHQRLLLADLVLDSPFDLRNEFTLIELNISPDTIIVSDISVDGEISFAKTAAATADPLRKEGESTFLASDGRVFLFRTAVIHKVETGIRIQSGVDDSGPWVSLLPCRSSRYRLDLNRTLTLHVPSNRTTWSLRFRNAILVLEDPAVALGSAIALAGITIRLIGDVRCVDLRQSGGSLPEEMTNDYRLLDIGNPIGRPIRCGGTILVFLPERATAYREQIQTALTQHAAAGTVPLIIFE